MAVSLGRYWSMAGYEDGDTPAPQVGAARDSHLAGRDLHVNLAPAVGSRDEGGPGTGFGGAAGVQAGSGNTQVNNYFYGNQMGADDIGTSMPVSRTLDSPHRGHAFISYVREDSSAVDVLQRMLEAAAIPVWRDTASLWPGEDWRARIRDAITRDALVFIACFSSHSAERQKSYQNEGAVAGHRPAAAATAG